MKRDALIRLSTSIALISILLLVYWTFTFISITVFDFKIFKENITESFFLSILGIFSILGGSLIVNLILNLNKIGEFMALQHTQGETPSSFSTRYVIMFVALFPLIFGVLYFGDMASTAKKKTRLLNAAKQLVESNKKDLEKICNYDFNPDYIEYTESVLSRITREERYFPAAAIVVSDSIDEHETFLEFERQYSSRDESKDINKVDFVRKCTQEEKDYLNAVFKTDHSNPRYSAHKGEYELFYPIRMNTGTIVLYLSEHSRYGKLGS